MVYIIKNMLKKYPLNFASAIIAGTLSTFSAIALMGLSGYLIASAAFMPPIYTLAMCITGVRVCGISKAVFRYLERLLTHKVGFAFFNAFRLDILGKVVDKVPFNIKNSNKAYDLIVESVDNFRDALLRFLLPPITILFSLCLVAIFFHLEAPELNIILLLSILVFFVVLPCYLYNQYIKINKNYGDITAYVEDLYYGNMEIKNYNYQGKILAKADTYIIDYQKDLLKKSKIKNKGTLYSDILGNALFILAIIISTKLYLNNELSSIMWVSMLLTMQIAIEFCQSVPSLTFHYVDGKKAQDNLKSLLQKNKDNKLEATNIPLDNGYFKGKGIAFGYEENIIEDLEFDIEKGDKVLILGSSGSGKSTLFYIFTKLMKYRKGKILLDNKDDTMYTDDIYRAYFSAMMQAHHLFNGTVRENFKLLIPSITDEEIINSLQKLSHPKFKTIEDLDFVLTNNGSNLSGGQRQCLILAIIFAKNSEIILLDEPTAGLDLLRSRTLLNNINTHYDDKTIITSSHDLSLLQYFNKVIILGDKKVLEAGEIKVLLKNEQSILNSLLIYENII